MFPFWKAQPKDSKDSKKALEIILKKMKEHGVDAGIKELAALAASGYPEAEYSMGDISEFQLHSCKSAFGFYKSAAEHGHAQSQFCVANLYMTGKDGVKQDKQRAAYWYHKAAENNVAGAQFVLGELYRSGEPDAKIPKDTKRSLAWYKTSLGNGYKPAAMRIEQFFPKGVFQERTPPSNEAPRASAETLKITESLRSEIVAAMQKEKHIPQDELPHIPELVPYSEKLVAFVCSSINEDMKTRGLDDQEMIKVFKFVFFRTFDLVHKWHKSANGAIDANMVVGNPLKEDGYLQLPKDIVSSIQKMQAPQIIYGIMNSWWQRNSQDLRTKGVDIWVPLSAALLMTSLTSVSIALKMFGYRK